VQIANSKLTESWLGGLADEHGGSGVWFDFPHDDVTAVDLRQLKRLVVMSIELLCHEHKWEKLVDVGLRFEAVTRYARHYSMFSLSHLLADSLISMLIYFVYMLWGRSFHC